MYDQRTESSSRKRWYVRRQRILIAVGSSAICCLILGSVYWHFQNPETILDFEFTRRWPVFVKLTIVALTHAAALALVVWNAKGVWRNAPRVIVDSPQSDNVSLDHLATVPETNQAGHAFQLTCKRDGIQKLWLIEDAEGTVATIPDRPHNPGKWLLVGNDSFEIRKVDLVKNFEIHHQNLTVAVNRYNIWTGTHTITYERRSFRTKRPFLTLSVRRFKLLENDEVAVEYFARRRNTYLVDVKAHVPLLVCAFALWLMLQGSED